MYGVVAVYPDANIFTANNLPKSLMTISGIFKVYVKVRVNATVKVNATVRGGYNNTAILLYYIFVSSFLIHGNILFIINSVSNQRKNRLSLWLQWIISEQNCSSIALSYSSSNFLMSVRCLLPHINPPALFTCKFAYKEHITV